MKTKVRLLEVEDIKINKHTRALAYKEKEVAYVELVREITGSSCGEPYAHFIQAEFDLRDDKDELIACLLLDESGKTLIFKGDEDAIEEYLESLLYTKFHYTEVI